MSEKFAVRLAQANLTGKTDIADFVKHLKKVTSNKMKHALVENGLNELLETIKAISTEGLTKDLINEYSILNDTKYF